MRFNKYFPFAFVYFFINSLGLPFGLTWTTVLSLLFYVWVVGTRKKEILWPFLLALTPLVLIQLALGVDRKSYFISFLSITAVYIFCQAFYTFLKICSDIESILRQLLIINFVLCLISIPFYFTPYYFIFWSKQFLTTGVYDFLRLSMFTYEPSYYALLFTPLFLYFFLQIIFSRNTINAWWLLVMIVLPYVLSFSLGVISAIAIAVGITFLFYFKTFITNRRVLHLLALAGILVVAAIGITVIFFPDNILIVRIANVLNGKDPSAKGRTFEAFWLAEQLLKQKSYWWGIGAGQIKILGFELIRAYYGYGYDTTSVAIPNAAAETLAIFGWVGLTGRILTEVILFFYTRVWRNYYRLALFLFIFIYQFTGSFITNVAEYVIWIIAFTPVFEQFDVKASPLVSEI